MKRIGKREYYYCVLSFSEKVLSFSLPSMMLSVLSLIDFFVKLRKSFFLSQLMKKPFFKVLILCLFAWSSQYVELYRHSSTERVRASQALGDSVLHGRESVEHRQRRT